MGPCLDKHYSKQITEGSRFTCLTPFLISGQCARTDRKIYLKVCEKSVRFDLLDVKYTANTD